MDFSEMDMDKITIFVKNEKVIVMPKIKHGFSGEGSIILPPNILQILEEDPLTSMLYLTWIGYYPKAKYHHRKRNESIDQYILIYCVDGFGWYAVRGEKFNVGPGNFFVLPAGEPHEYAADVENPWTIYWIHFKGSIVDNITEGSIKPRKIESSPKSRIGERIELFEEMYNLMNRGFSMANMHYLSSLFHHFMCSLYYVEQYRFHNCGNEHGESVISVIEHYMQENMDKHLTLADIAAYSDYSPSHITMLFKRVTGKSPLAYFNQMKIRYAATLLDNSNMKINQIAYKVGIEDSLYFSRLFKKIMGVSPSKYRTMQKT